MIFTINVFHYHTIKLGPVGKKRRDKSFSSILFHFSFLNTLLTLQSEPALRTPALGGFPLSRNFYYRAHARKLVLLA